MVRAGESPAVYGDNRKAFARLGWTPRPIADGLMRLAQEQIVDSEIPASSKRKFSIVQAGSPI